jgi:hypothetical protein
MGFFSRIFGKRKVNKAIVDFSGPGTYRLDIVGESNYQSALEKICGGSTYEGQELIIEAVLVPEDDNPYDKNAIRVDMSGKTVGYLSREKARQYRKKLEQAGYSVITAKCSAMIIGGWDRGRGDKGHFGVKLDLQTEDQSHKNSKELFGVSEFIFTIDKLNAQELTQAKIGDTVNFWAPDDDPTKVMIYRRGSLGGQGKLGVVPNTYARLIANHRALQLPIETEILEKTPSKCIIRCRLVPAEEINREKNMEQQKLRTELTKPYRPKKPVVFSVDVKSYSFNIGDRLKLATVPSIEECIEDIYKVVLVFSSIDGKKTIEKRDEPAIKKKIVRLTHTFSYLDIHVISKADEKPWYESEYKLQVIPVDT